LYSKPLLIWNNGGTEVIWISEAKGSPKRQEKLEHMNGKFDDISSADENK
jgi:hypothetical protein